MPINKPPDKSDTTLNSTLRKELAPYIREYYQDLKRDGETLSDFMIRIISDAAFSHVVSKNHASIIAEQRALDLEEQIERGLLGL